MNNAKYLITTGTGRIGRRVVSRLTAMNLDVRVGSRSGQPPFDWQDRSTWDAALDGVYAAYIAYLPDLVVPGAEEAVESFVTAAINKGVERLVLLSGRGEVEGYGCERIVRESGLAWTIVRAGWFMQNFTEGDFSQMIHDGTIALPAQDIPEPFVDVEEIADVVAAALTDDRHNGELYEVTGPRALTFTELANELSTLLDRDISFFRVSQQDFDRELAIAGVPDDVIWLMGYLFTTVLDGRNSKTGDGVQRALGREPRDFRDFVQRAVAESAWSNGDLAA